jgi:hypothetical protein
LLKKFKKMKNKSEDLFEELSSIHSMLDQIEGFKKKTNSILYSAKDLNIEPRFVNQWKGKGLLFKEIVKGSTNNYSFIDCVWLKCIEKMRNFGIEFKIIQSFKEKLIHTFNKVDIESMFQQGLIDILKSKNQEVSENEILEMLKKIDPSDFNVQINLLELAIYDMFINKLTYTFKINQEGDFYFIKEGKNSDNIEISDAIEVFLNGNYFNLSLSEILSSIFFDGISFDFIAEEKKTALSKDELTILKTMRDSNVIKVELIYDKKNPEVLHLMHSTKQEKFYAEKRLSDYIFKNRYNKVVVTSYGDGKAIVENEIKTKFN